MHLEIETRQRQGNCNSAAMVDSILVPKVDGTVSSRTFNSSKKQKSVASESQHRASSATQKASSDSMSSVRKGFRQQGISRRTVNIIMQSWKPGTKNQYQTYIQKWFQYCRKKQISYFPNTVNPVLDFLTELFDDQGLGYSSLNTARAALSSLGIKVDNIEIGRHALVIRFMKGVFNLRPSRPKYQKIWDVKKVLNYLCKLSPIKFLSLQNLTLKLVMLIALTNAARCQSIHLMDVHSVNKLKGEFVFVINDLIKQSRPGYEEPTVNIKAYPPDRRLCVYSVYKEYMLRTKHLRENHSKLLVSYIKPHQPVTKDTVSRWIKTVLARAKIDINTYTAHSVRAASVSKARQNFLPISKILDKAGWSNVNTFARFYNKKVDKDDESFSFRVLKD